LATILFEHAVCRFTPVLMMLMFATNNCAVEVGSANCWIASIFAPALSDERTVSTLKPAISSAAYIALSIS
jgi:hypothetical protein